MKKHTFTGHMLVKNEANWIYYSIKSVIDFVDKMIIFDTGSVDDTQKIIEYFANDERYKEKIVYEEKGPVTKENLHLLRQEMIDMTDTDYFFVVDGDEIWYPDVLDYIRNLLDKAEPEIDLLWTKDIYLGGDIYHYRDEKREMYHVVCSDGVDMYGPYTIRFYSMKIPGINCSGDYGVEGFFDKDGVAVQDGPWNIVLGDGVYLHTSYLPRAGVNGGDKMIEYRAKKGRVFDHRFALDFIFPPALYERPVGITVYDPWKHRVTAYGYIVNYMLKIRHALGMILRTLGLRK